MKHIDKINRLAWIISCGTHLMQITGCTVAHAMSTSEALWRQLGDDRPEPMEAAQTTARTVLTAIAHDVAA